MQHTEETITAALPEPPDGTRLVVEAFGDPGGELTVIWRDDLTARTVWGSVVGDRWFDDGNSDPMSLYQHVKHAAAVYPFGALLVRFADSDKVA